MHAVFVHHPTANPDKPDSPLDLRMTRARRTGAYDESEARNEDNARTADGPLVADLAACRRPPRSGRVAQRNASQCEAPRRRGQEWTACPRKRREQDREDSAPREAMMSKPETSFPTLDLAEPCGFVI